MIGLLIYYFVHVTGSVAEATTALSSSFGEMSAWAQMAYRQGEELRLRMDPGRWLPAKDVRLEIGETVALENLTIIPISWKAIGGEMLFPIMQADLVVEPLGQELVKLTFRGSYEPPLGAVGRIIDRALLHRLAEESVKHFLDRLAIAVERAIAKP